MGVVLDSNRLHAIWISVSDSKNEALLKCKILTIPLYLLLIT